MRMIPEKTSPTVQTVSEAVALAAKADVISVLCQDRGFRMSAYSVTYLANHPD